MHRLEESHISLLIDDGFDGLDHLDSWAQRVSRSTAVVNSIPLRHFSLTGRDSSTLGQWRSDDHKCTYLRTEFVRLARFVPGALTFLPTISTSAFISGVATSR